MKIRTADYAGLVFNDKRSHLHQEIITRAGVVVAQSQPGSIIDGLLITPDIYHARKRTADILMAPFGFTHYLITEQAQKIAATVKIDKSFNWRLLNKLRPQSACYLLNPNEFVRFVSFEDGLVIFNMTTERDAGGRIYTWHTRLLQIDYETGLMTTNGLEKVHEQIAFRLARIITFVEMSEPELLLVEAHSDSKNRKAPLNDRIENKSDVAITRVHSNWNKFIINVSQIGVKGFLRLQACGPQWSQRKLTWVQAHTRNGFKRRNKGGTSL